MSDAGPGATMKVVIMAGGRGTRIASLRADVPKPMIPIAGKPILAWQIENLKACGLTDITLVIGYLGSVVRDYFGDGSAFGVQIRYFEESEPLGTAGALFKMPELTEDFLLLCGDVVLDLDFRRFIAFHRAKGAWASLMAHPNGHPYDSSLLVCETLPPAEEGGLPVETGRVVAWLNKEDPRQYYKNRVNAGIEILSPALLSAARRCLVPRHPEAPDRIDLDRDVLKPMIPGGRIYAYDTPEYIKDVGTPERFRETEEDLLAGRVRARNLSQPQRAVFLDRDGTLNRHIGFLTRPEELELLPGAAEAVRLLNRAGYLAIVVTNQPVIARGECSFGTLQAIHDKLETELGREGAFLDAVYYCPHHPDRGFPGERPAYKVACTCRKPQPGLLLRAAADFHIDLSQSILIGDRDGDVETGLRAGCARSLKVETNAPGALLALVKQIILPPRRA